MATTSVLNWNKKEVGQIPLPAEIFEIPIQRGLLSELVRWQRAKRRQGTHSTKTRAQVRGGGKKPFRQKGTGNARQGSIRSPLLRGGGVLFGPTPRSYAYSLPKKIRLKGLKMALSYLRKKEKIFVVQEMASTSGKTKELCIHLKRFGLDKVLLVDKEKDPIFFRACRNLPHCCYYGLNGLNVFDLLKYNNLIMTLSALESLVERCLGKKEREKIGKVKRETKEEE